MAIWSALSGFIGGYNDSVAAERQARAQAQASEKQLENQKTLAVFKNNLIESGKNKRNILGNLAQIIAQTSSTRQRRELLENYKKLAIKFAPVEYVPTAEDIETSLGVVKTKEQQGINTSDGDATFGSSPTNQRRQVVQPVS
tara:strand:+ start:491 stop:916 length:426 start_codon:yes stop_codon:yes gene_type:complete